MKVTKAMITKAEREHWRKEDLRSLNKLHRLKYLYYMQQGDKKSASYFKVSRPKRRIRRRK